MQFKPFRPPSFLARQPPDSAANPPSSPAEISDEPPIKKRRLSQDDSKGKEQVNGRALSNLAVFNNAPVVPLSSQNGFRTPLTSLKQPSQAPKGQPSGSQTFRALYRKITTKKHKTWDGDGTVVISAGYAELRNDKGKYLGRTKCAAANLDEVEELKIGGMDVEVGEKLSEDDAPQVDTGDELPKPVPTFTRPMSLTRPDKIPTELADVPPLKVANQIVLTQKAKLPLESQPKQVLGARPRAYINPLSHSSARSTSDGTPTPRHDPQAEGALVMKRPTAIGKQLVDVVVDPILSKRLREHQRAGVAFLYECVMGMRCREGLGAILADEMGLGKTLQTIALLWTLLKQTPFHGEGPVVRKAIIICPVSVAKNWRKEFRKWLGNERVGVLILDDQKKIRSFTRGKSYQVLVVGYEMFNLVHKDLQKCDEIDIIIADEGHRLKTAKNKTAAAIKSLDVERRIVLTGTPLQNDYSEWYSVVDFVNPGYLGKYTSFKKDFETPILRARQQGASPDDLEKGEEADRELKRQTGAFILRRSADLLAEYLPPKTEYVLLCRPTEFQTQVYNALLSSGTLSAALRSPELSFQMITLLKKACNSPSLLSSSKDKEDSLVSPLAASFPPTMLKATATSGKIRALDALLHFIRTTTDEKVVIASNYTSTLDVLGNLLTGMDHGFVRLDGTTPSKQRQDMVDTFNSSPQSRLFCFLLSTKAGGLGINLIGASRLILFDLDWNPALDAQTMARTHRDGQKRPCFIYRLVAKGAIEEKIFQRQCAKTDLAGAVVDDRRSVQAFSQDTLRDLFRLDLGSACATHEALGCKCSMTGASPDSSAKASAQVSDDDDELPQLEEGTFRPASAYRAPSPVKEDKPRGLMLYSHLDARAWRESRGAVDLEDDDEDEDEPVHDPVLKAVLAQDGSAVDFVFAKRGAAREIV